MPEHARPSATPYALGRDLSVAEAVVIALGRSGPSFEPQWSNLAQAVDGYDQETEHYGTDGVSTSPGEAPGFQPRELEHQAGAVPCPAASVVALDDPWDAVPPEAWGCV